MARIQTYIVDTVLSDSDLILGSNADDSLDTVNFRLSDVKAYVLSGASGSVTSVSGTGTVSGLTLTGTVTSSGSLTLGGTLVLTSSDITTGLGFTPYDATNPDGFTSNPSYDYSAVGAAGNINMALSGSDGSNDVVTMQAGSNITLTDNGNNTFTIASTGGGGGGGGVTSFTNTNGTFVGAQTQNAGATGAVTTGVIDLLATGIPSATTFLRGDNTWAALAGSGTVTEVTAEVLPNVSALDVTVQNSTTNPNISIAWQGPDNTRLVAGDGTLVGLTTTGTSGAATLAGGVLNVPNYSSNPGSGTVTSVGVSMPSAFTVSNSPITSEGTIAISGAGTGAQYVNGLGALAALNTIPTNINLTTTGTSGAATLLNNNLNIPQYVTSAAGSNGDVQFNNNGAFAAESQFNYNTGTNTLTVTGTPQQPSLRLASEFFSLPGSNIILSEIESYYSAGTIGKMVFISDAAFVSGSSYPTRLELQTTSAGNTDATTKATLHADGKLNLGNYGSGTFAGISVAPLGVTATGDVVENLFSRPAQPTNISYDTNLEPAFGQYKVESVGSGSIGAPTGDGKVRVRFAVSNQAQNVEEITVANSQLNGTNNALSLQNMAVGGTITLTQVGGGSSGVLTYTIKERINETGYVRFQLTYASGQATYVILTTTTDTFTFDADYEHALSSGYNRLSVTNNSGSSTNKFRMAPPASATIGEEIIVELNRSSTAGPDIIPSYVVRDGNNTFLKTRTVTEINGTTINNIQLSTNDTAIIKFQVNIVGSVKGLTILGANQMIYA